MCFGYNIAIETGTLYKDGALVASSASFKVDNESSYTGSIGVENGAYYFSGLIDDVRIYNRALSASEIAVIYNAEK